MVRQVVGVGSVGMRVYLVLLEGRTGADPLFLQAKQAGPSVYEAHTQPSRHGNHGERVINGKRMVQSATDIFVGWGSLHGRDYYVRQFRDMKIIPTTELIAPRLAEFATACGGALARAHARTGDPVAIDSYIGKGPSSPPRSAGSPIGTPTRTKRTTPSSSRPSPPAPFRVCQPDDQPHSALCAAVDRPGGLSASRETSSAGYAARTMSNRSSDRQPAIRDRALMASAGAPYRGGESDHWWLPVETAGPRARRAGATR